MLWQIAWRNLWRSKGKTLVSLLLLTFSTMMLSTFISVITGTFHKIYEDAVDIFPGLIQVSQIKYRDEPNYEHLLDHESELKAALSSHKEIKAVTSRMESFFLFTSKENSVGGLLTGINPSTEIMTSKLHKTVIKGRYLEDNDTQSVVIGDVLAQKLQIGVGDTLSILGSAIDYSFAADNLTVVGIFHTAIIDLDSRFSVINKTYLDTLIGSADKVSRIIVTPFERRDSIDIAQELQKTVGTPTIEVVDWHTHLSALIDSLELIRISRYMLIYFFIAIIFAVISIFALLMLLARQKEIGIMKALGTTPLQIVKILFIERFVLSCAGISVGTSFAAMITYYLQTYPIRINGIEDMLHQMGAMEFLFKAQFSGAIMSEAASIIFFFSFLTIIYPTWRLSRQKPLQAINAL